MDIVDDAVLGGRVRMDSCVYDAVPPLIMYSERSVNFVSLPADMMLSVMVYSAKLVIFHFAKLNFLRTRIEILLLKIGNH